MKKNSKLRRVLYILVIVVVVFSVGNYFEIINLNNLVEEKPYEVIKPETGFIPGTTVNLYKNPPPGFPAEVILENKPVYHSVSVNTPDGKKQIVVSYISDQNPIDVANMYISSLSKDGWSVVKDKISKNVSIIQAIQRNKNVIITFGPGITLDMISSLVTFQYTI